MNFPGVVFGVRTKSTADAKNMVARRSKGERKLSPSNARIREIRKALGLSQEGFSIRLNIPTATLLSYEYGRTPNVPQHIMEAAEEIYRQNEDVAKRNMANHERPMAAIVEEWAKMLGVPKDDMKTISEILDVSKSTVHRWINGEMRPRPIELHRYTQAVKQIAKRIEAGSKAASGLL